MKVWELKEKAEKRKVKGKREGSRKKEEWEGKLLSCTQSTASLQLIPKQIKRYYHNYNQ